MISYMLIVSPFILEDPPPISGLYKAQLPRPVDCKTLDLIFHSSY